ncbi:MAG: polyprenyl synthetase family protein, partial [Actinobacteria bacterium]|nr:polyprenyl synthetase family protein [Actinomycetota bacterium]
MELLSIGSELIPVAESMSAFITDGGKRFRPIFANIGYLGAGHELRNEVLRASIALELVHVCALIHDDLMDGSDMRRNRPAIHKFFENVHTKNSYEGVKERFGAAAAILLGDLALVWADRAFHESGISNVEIATSFP